MQRTRIRRSLFFLCLVLASAQAVASQAPAATRTFEVASIKPNEHWKYTTPGYSLDSDEDFVAGQPLFVADVSLPVLIAFAYKLNMQFTMLADLPKWATERTLHVSARIPGNPTKDQVRAMMKALLAERFHLALHFEQQEKPAFALTLAKEGQFGPGLHRFESCKVEGAPPAAGAPSSGLRWLPCNVYIALDRPGHSVFVAARNTTMSQMCAFLSNVGNLGRMVVDRSGITGPIDFGIEYKKDLQVSDDEPGSASEPLESALKTQLGVKLTPVKAQVRVPVLDRLDPLTED